MDQSTLKLLLTQVRDIAKSKKPQSKSSKLLIAQCESYLSEGIQFFPLETSRYLGEIHFNYKTFNSMIWCDTIQFSIDVKNGCIKIIFHHPYPHSWQFYSSRKQEQGIIFPGIVLTFDQLKTLFDEFLHRIHAQGIPLTQEDFFHHYHQTTQESIVCKSNK